MVANGGMLVPQSVYISATGVWPADTDTIQSSSVVQACLSLSASGGPFFAAELAVGEGGDQLTAVLGSWQ